MTEGRPISLENPEFMKLRVKFDRRGDVDVKRRLIAGVQTRLDARTPGKGESGFSLMEAVLAMALFALIATALLGVLVSGVSAQRLSRQKTISEQAATAQVENIRTLAYSQVGNPGKNPSGTIPLTQSIAAVLGSTNPGLTGTVTSKVEWNNNPSDKVSTAYRNAAFYKKVTITVTRSDGKQMSQMVTYVADTGVGSGVNDAEIDLSVLDIGSTTPIATQDVDLTTGPSAPLNDTTDAAGSIVFPALTANPTSGPTAYYNLSMTPPAGYTLLKDDDIVQTPSSANAHVQLAPSQIFPTTLRVYKGSTITVALQNQTDGSTYAGNATVTLATTLRGSAATQNLSYSGGPVATTTFAGEKVIPAPSPVISGGYTASVSNGFYATAVNKATVPNSYPTDLTSTFTLTGYPTGTLTATVTWAGSAVSGATVSLTGGPVSVNQNATTNGSGVATFTDLPAGSGYSLTATKGGQTSAASSATVVAGTTTNVPIAMPVGTVAVTVTSAGSPISGATVTLTGGNITGTITAGTTTDVNGQVTITNVPAGSGITVTATKGLQTGSTPGVSVTGGSTTNVTVAMPLGTIAVTVLWAGVPVANCVNCVTLSGGALSSPVTGTTNGSGQVTFLNVPAASGYTVSATKNSQTGQTSGVTVTGGSTTNVTVNLPVGNVAVTVTWVGAPVANCANCVTISGGNLSAPVTGSTNASGQVTFSNVPAGSGYTVTATKNGQTGTTSGVSVSNGVTTPVTVVMPTGTITVTVTWAGQPTNTAAISITGGPSGASYSGTTNSSGVASITVPATTAGFPFTVSATKNNGAGNATVTTLASGGTATPAIALTPTKTFTITVQKGGVAIPGTSVTISVTGGPGGTLGANPAWTFSGVLNASSQATITVPQGVGSFTYTFKAYLTACTGATNRSGQTTGRSDNSATTTATVNMTTATCPWSPLP